MIFPKSSDPSLPAVRDIRSYQSSPKKRNFHREKLEIETMFMNTHLWKPLCLYQYFNKTQSFKKGLGWTLPRNVAPKAPWNKWRSWKKLWSWVSNPKLQADGRSRFCPELVERNVFRKVVEQKAYVVFLIGILFILKFVATIIAVVVFKKHDVIFTN